MFKCLSVMRSAVAAGGYTHPSLLPKEALMPYAAKVREGMERADLRYLDVWWAGGIERDGRLQPFLKAAGVYGMTQWDNKQAVIYREGGMRGDPRQRYASM